MSSQNLVLSDLSHDYNTNAQVNADVFMGVLRHKKCDVEHDWKKSGFHRGRLTIGKLSKVTS